jgi:hypothetical protein
MFQLPSFPLDAERRVMLLNTLDGNIRLRVTPIGMGWTDGEQYCVLT